MKVSDLLKKIGSIGGAEIHIAFKADRKDPEPETVTLNEYTPEEAADQVIARAAEYSVQEINIAYNDIQIVAVKVARRPPRRKEDRQGQQGQQADRDQAIREELEHLKRAVERLKATIAAPLRRKEDGGTGAGTIFRNVRAAVRRILTRIFRKGAPDDENS